MEMRDGAIHIQETENQEPTSNYAMGRQSSKDRTSTEKITSDASYWWMLLKWWLLWWLW